LKTPTKFKFVKKFFNGRMADDFTPLKVFCKWSKLMTATYVLFVDFRKCNISKTVREKFVEKINNIWGNNNSQLLPTHDDLMAKHIWYKYLQKPGKHFPPNFGHSGKSRLNAEGRNRMAGSEYLSANSNGLQPTLDMNKSYEYVETGIDWKNKKMISRETGIQEDPPVNYVEDQRELQRLASGKSSPKKSVRRFKKKSEDVDFEEMVIDFDEDRDVLKTANKSPSRLSKRSRKMSPNLRSKKSSKNSIRSSPKISKHSNRRGSPSFANHNRSSKAEGRFQSPSLQNFNESPSNKKSNLKKGNSKYEKSSREVKFDDDKGVRVRGSKEILKDIERLKNKKNLTKDQRRLLTIYEQMK
jgi:hypothetical protein